MPEAFSDDVDPKQREPLAFPDRAVVDDKTRVFDDTGVMSDAELRTHGSRKVSSNPKIVDFDAGGVVIQFPLTIAEQRAIVEAEACEPCFRMWLSKDEAERVDFVEWVQHDLSDGRVAVWRKCSELSAIMKKDLSLFNSISSRIIEDDVI